MTRLGAALRKVVSRPTAPPKPPSLDEIGRALDLDQSSLGHDHLRHYESALEDLGRSPRSIVVVAGRHPRATGLAFVRRYPQADVHVLSFVPGAVRPGDPATLRVQPVEDVDGVLDALAGIADIDLLVDDGRHLKSEKRRLLRECLFAVADGGVYAVEDLHGLTIDSMLDVPGEDVLDLVQGIQRRRVDGSLGDVPPRDDETALAAAVRGTVFRPRLLLLTKEGEHLVKLREDAPLEPIVRGRRGEWLEERRVEESFDFPTRVDVTTNRPDLGRHLVESIRVPELRVRTYTGVTVRPRLLRVHDGLVLPETFRLYRHARMKSTQLVDTSQRYAQVRVPDRSAPEPLAGTYYDLDSEHTGTFGHLVTEVVSKLWGWRAAREAHPDLKALVSPSDGTSTLPRWFVDMLDAYGIGEDRIEVLDRPRTVERLVSVTPLFSNPSVVHPRIRETWHDLRDSLLTRSSGLELPRRFFVGRAETLTRQCHNGREVEELFARHGFVKVFPERLSIPDQAALFAGAEAIAGYGGSGMLSSIFTPDDIPRFVISPEGYDAMNEFLIAAAQGGSLHYYYCPADVPRGRSWSSAAYFSDFTFDVEKDGPDLAERLAAL
ncbi:glycosyltransferase family 61 protein [Oerskovia sp. Sa1BUA8]|uniref:Glycosyltransferase family 61 protein n=1 Tax=Oerskovia douganii TaxID=2762210 RepID=A0A9D5U7V6_9CELL|nr:glycosyltransferase 61 family protein [Oerskovia douganii]MBE7699515.1 glycosyltransferase family 61 protein [Oerskovia douganii]